jgi:RNA polymerase sigma-70 factor (ECF subfamily)
MSTSATSSLAEAALDLSPEEAWLAKFHAGHKDAMEAFYRDYFDTVDAAVARVLRGADRETVVQDVFARLLSDSNLRMGFKGGRLPAWLGTLSHNLAIDFVRHRKFEQPDGLVPASAHVHAAEIVEHGAEARMLIDRFRKECLPPRWETVFEFRFVRQMDQSAAARHIGISRTTLAYQEYRIRRLLRSFALRERSRPR